MKEEKPLSLKITNQTLISYIRRIQRTGLYGDKETETAEKIIENHIDYLFKSGELKRQEAGEKETTEIERFVAKKSENTGK